LNQVQIEILLLNSIAQRVSILKVHTKHMFAAGRLQVNDPPPGSPAARLLLVEGEKKEEKPSILTYEQLAQKLAIASEGFSGAAIAGVARAAASRALERAVSTSQQYDENDTNGSDDDNDNNDGTATPPPSSMMDCLVTQEDFDNAINDIRESMGTHDDHTEEDSSSSSDDNNLSTRSSSSSSSRNNNENNPTLSDDLLDGKHVNGVIIDDVVKDGSII